MIFNTRLLALATLASTLISALPLDSMQGRAVVPRAKSYSVVNVGGGASTEAPADATTVVDQTTKTVEVVGPTVTAEVTTTIVQPVPAPAATSTSKSTSSPTSTSRSTTTKASTSATPTPVFVTVTVTDDAGPTEYYDDGMWHTSYRVKTFATVAAPSLLSTISEVASSSTAVPA